MDFLKPKPIRRQKSKLNGFEGVYKKTIFDEIKSLCRIPQPLEPIEDLNTIFNDIRSLCRIPQLLEPIEDFNESQFESQISQSKPNKRRKRITSKQFYRDFDVTEEVVNKCNSFVNLNQSKLFCAVVKGKQINNNNNNNECINEFIVNNHKSSHYFNNKTKRPTLKSCPKTKSSSVCRLKPSLSIDCDISTKINEYSKEYSKPKLKRSSNTKKTVSNSSQESVSTIGETNNDSSDHSISSHLFSNNALYSLPATPISSSDSSVNSSNSTIESHSTQALLKRLRKALNCNLQPYRQYFEEEINSKTKKRKRLAKQEIDFKQKVLEWKANRISSGNATPIHDIEYLVTPPGSPLQERNDFAIDQELNAMISNLENENFNDFDLNDNMLNEFNNFLTDLYSDLPLV